jgi:hypothetical protein
MVTVQCALPQRIATITSDDLHDSMEQTDLFLVYSQYDNALVAANADKTVDRADTSTRKFAKKDHTLQTMPQSELLYSVRTQARGGVHRFHRTLAA